MLVLNYLFMLVLPTVLAAPLPNPYVVWHNPQNSTELAALATSSINFTSIATNANESHSDHEDFKGWHGSDGGHLGFGTLGVTYDHADSES